MRCAVFSTKHYDRQFLEPAFGNAGHEPTFFEPRLTPETCVLANDHQAVCAFVNDQLNRTVLERLAEQGVKVIALRCAGFNHVDLEAARELKLKVVRVPAYSPHAVAEHTLGLILCLNRKLHKANQRVRDNNFSLDGLLGFDLFEKTVGVIGTGAIGTCVARILNGFGCNVLLHDPSPNANCEKLGTYVSIERLLSESHIITLHCPLTPATKHLINEASLASMKPGVMLVNTSRGGLIDTKAAIKGLKTGHIGTLALDVYEEESELFFEDLSQEVIQDDIFSRLLTFPNVLISAHQAFFTREALQEIASVTARNLSDIEQGIATSNAVC